MPALRADHHWIEHLSAKLVLIEPGPPTLVDHVDVAPMHDRHHDRVEIESLLGQDVFVALRPRLVRNSTQYAVAHQLPEPVGQNVARHFKPRLKILKAPHP